MYAPAKTVQQENLIGWTAAQAMAGRPLMQGPLKLHLDVACQVPASWSNKKRLAALRGETRPTTKPDLDNVIKLADALNGVVWVDDAQVVSIWAVKRYDESPGMSFLIETLA